MRSTSLIRAAVSAVAIATIALSTACSSTNSVEEFCALAKTHESVGPLFPHRLDGEPVPNYEALEWLRDLSDQAPDEVSSELEILVAEAEALVAQAEARQSSNPDVSIPEAPTKASVDSAQLAVISYFNNTCEVDVS